MNNKPYSRECPQCHDIIYHTNKNNCKSSIKCNRICRKCKGEKHKIFMSGVNNPFYGKKHSAESISKIRNSDKSYRQSDKYRKIMSIATKGANNPMYGRSVYSIWLKKYGKEIADEKLKNWKILQSTKNRGKDNHWYGKCPPQGVGYGWKGWYKGHYFRSLREVSYMIYLDENCIKWQSAEKLDYYIEYTDYNNNIRTYIPDFLVNDCELIEIKPIRLHNAPKTIAKKLAAEKFCINKNLTYKLIDFQIDAEKIKQKLESKEIRFHRDYEQKFLNYIS